MISAPIFGALKGFAAPYGLAHHAVNLRLNTGVEFEMVFHGAQHEVGEPWVGGIISD